MRMILFECSDWLIQASNVIYHSGPDSCETVSRSPSDSNRLVDAADPMESADVCGGTSAEDDLAERPKKRTKRSSTSMVRRDRHKHSYLTQKVR